jgi:purine-nucleoside phosphorylase
MPIQSGARRRVTAAGPPVALYDQVQHAADAARAQLTRGAATPMPEVAVILGTGLAKLIDQLQSPRTVGYEDLPHMPRSTAPTHKGQLAVGTLAGKPVLVMDGRFHLYEGYSARQVAFPVWVMKALGVKTLLVSNIAGGLNPNFKIGDLMLIADHINWLGTSPLVGDNDERLGPRFPDMCQPYDAELLAIARRVGKRAKLPMREGVYVAMLGPQLETKAEYRLIRTVGADAVGMSTVPEVIAAVHAGMRVLAVSLISDLCLPETLKPANIEELIAVANRAEPQLTRLFTDVVAAL